MTLLWLLFILLALISLASVGLAAFSMIVWVPTRRADLARILALANPKPNQLFVDLGCGTGTVACHIAANSQAQVLGLELALPLYLWCELRRRLSRAGNLTFRWQDLFRADLGQADIVYVFGIPDRLKTKLRPKLERELKPGCLVLSYAFAIEGWEPAFADRPDPESIAIYGYIR